MKKIKNLSIIIILFGLFVICNSGFVNASSIMLQYEEIVGSGVIPIDKKCPVNVLQKDLTFKIDLDNPVDTLGTVSAKYSFFNPTNNDVTLHLAVPINSRHNNITIDFFESSQFSIMVNNKQIDKKIRYTLQSDESIPNKTVINQARKISDEYIKDGYFNEDLKIYAYNYSISANDTNENSNRYINFKIPKGFSGKILTKYDYVDYKNGVISILDKMYLDNETVTIYSIGEEIGDISNFAKIIDMNDMTNTIDGDIKLNSTIEIKLRDLVLSNYNKDSEILEVDWYNAIIDLLNYNNSYYDEYVINEDILDIENSLDAWFEYEFVIGPMEKCTNEVITPIYPSINHAYNPTLYSYNYYLTPASCWNDFKNLNIKIITSSYVNYSNLGKFVKNSDGDYELNFTNLPIEDLEFRVSNSETYPIYRNDKNFSFNPIIMVLFAFVLVGIITMIVVLITYKKRKIPVNKIKLILFIGIIIQIVIFILTLIGITGNKYIIILNVIMMLIYLMLLLIERFYLHNIISGRSCAVTIELVLYLFLIAASNSIVDFNVITFIFSPIIIIMSLYNALKIDLTNKKSGVTQKNVGDNNR